MAHRGLRRAGVFAAFAMAAFQNGIAQNAGAPAASPPPIRDIAPPVDVLPYPLWMIAAAAGAALLLVVLAVWLLMKWLRNRPAPLPPTPREAALADLREAEARLDALDAHGFSILVSDILRRYVSAQFGLRATRQTSPEFLASVADSPRFSADEKLLLGAFLEKSDMIKFAHIEATRGDSAALLAQARSFVESAGAQDAATARASGAPAAAASPAAAGGAR